MTIIELEREIHLLRGQLNADNERLMHLEREFVLLKQGQMPMKEQMPPQNQMQRQMKEQMPPQNQIQRQMSGQMPPQNQIQGRNSVAKSDSTFDLEKFIGKSWMGIMASLLIFISIVLFAVTILPYLSDNMKMCIMYGVSIAFVGVGLGLFKKSGKLFYMILSACGMGALYISILLSNIYFRAIGDVMLYVFILTWAVGIAIVAKNNVRTFSVVGNVGIVISILLGTVKCITAEDSVKFMVLMLFFILSAVVYGIINNRFYFTNTISNFLGMLILTMGYGTLGATNIFLFALLLGACIAQLVYLTYKQIRPYFVLHIIHLWLAFLLMGIFVYAHIDWLSLFEFVLNDYILAFAIYVCSLLSILFMEFFKNRMREEDSYNSKDIIQIVDIGTIVLVLLGCHIHIIWFLLLVPVVFLGIGFFKKDEKFTVAAVIALALSVFANDSLPAGGMILVIAAAAVALKQNTEDSTSDVLRAITSVIMQITILQFVYELYDKFRFDVPNSANIMLLFLLVIDLVFKYKLSHEGRDKGIVIVSDVSSILCASVVTAMLLWGDDGLNYYLTLLIGCVFFMNNVTRFLKSQIQWKQLYAMIKLSFYLMVVLISLEQASIVLSIVFFVAAILWILLGFYMDAKAIRLYGLVTSLISIAKLILVDIQYNSSLGKALGFFLCGILAFVISFIYNWVEKRKE